MNRTSITSVFMKMMVHDNKRYCWTRTGAYECIVETPSIDPLTVWEVSSTTDRKDFRVELSTMVRHISKDDRLLHIDFHRMSSDSEERSAQYIQQHGHPIQGVSRLPTLRA